MTEPAEPRVPILVPPLAIGKTPVTLVVRSIVVFAIMPLVTLSAPMVVALPEEVTSPVRLALVVTVEALPVTLPVKLPANPVAVSIPVEGLKDNFVEDVF